MNRRPVFHKEIRLFGNSITLSGIGSGAGREAQERGARIRSRPPGHAFAGSSPSFDLQPAAGMVRTRCPMSDLPDHHDWKLRQSEPLRNRSPMTESTGGAGGIRTLDTLLRYTPLAGERFQPLSHRSVSRIELGNVERGKPQGGMFVNGRERVKLNFRAISKVWIM